MGYLLGLRGYLLGEKIWRNFGEAIEEPEPGGAGFLRVPADNPERIENGLFLFNSLKLLQISNFHK